MSRQIISREELIQRGGRKEGEIISREELIRRGGRREERQPIDPAMASSGGIGSFLRKIPGFVAEEGPAIAGATLGGALGVPLGPAGVAAGAAFGAGGGRALQDIFKQLSGDPTAPTPEQAAQRVTRSMMEGPFQEGARAIGIARTAGKALSSGIRGVSTPQASAAAEFNVPLTRAQRTQGPIVSAIENWMRKTLFGQAVFTKFDKAQNARFLSAATREIADTISDTRLNSKEAGVYIQGVLTEFNERLTRNYGRMRSRLSSRGADSATMPVDNIVDHADKLLGSVKTGIEAIDKATSGVEATGVARRVLIALRGLRQTVPVKRSTPVSSPPGLTPVAETVDIPIRRQTAVTTAQRVRGGRAGDVVDTVETIPGTIRQELPVIPDQPAQIVDQIESIVGEITVDRSVSFSQLAQMRTLIFKLTNTEAVPIGKNALRSMNAVIDETIQRGLKGSGMGDLADLYRASSTRFREGKELLETTIAKAVARSDNPAGVVSMLLRAEKAEGAADILAQAASRPSRRAAIQRTLWEEMADIGTTQGVFVKNQLENVTDRLGPEAMRAIFGSTHLEKIRRFVNLVDTASLRTTIKDPISAQQSNLLAMGEANAMWVSMTAAATSLFLGRPELAALAGAGGATVVLTPKLVARLMTRPAAVEVMSRAAQSSADGPGAAGLSLRLAVFIAAALKEDTGEQVEIDQLLRVINTNGTPN